MSTDTAADLPGTKHSVELHVVNGKSSLGRVQSASTTAIVVALPSDAGIASSVEVGDGLRVVWPARGGVLNLPVTLTRRQRSPQLEVWDLAPARQADFEQRRHEPRVRVRSALTFTLVAGTAPSTVSGTLIDVSASAAHCLLNVTGDDAVLTSGVFGTCEFTLGENRYSLHGEVQSVWTDDEIAGVRLVLRFDENQPELVALAQTIRIQAGNLPVV